MINVAIVGFGWWGGHLASRMAGSGNLNVSAVVEPDSGRAEAISSSGYQHLDDLQKVLTEPTIDAVVLASPGRLHCAQVQMAAAAGKHVFCEKPLSMTGADARRAVAACRDGTLRNHQVCILRAGR